MRLALAEVAPLAQAFGLPLAGEARGRLALSGEGEGEARLRLLGEPLEARYRGTTLTLLLPGREAGLSWDWRGGDFKGLLGLSGEGRLRLGEEVSGRLGYRGLELSFAGPWREVALEARFAPEGLGTTWAEARLDLAALRGEGRVAHASAYAEGRGASALREAATSFGGASEASPTSGRRGLSAWWERGLRRCFPGRRPWPSGRPTGRGLPSPSGARGRSWA